MINEAKIMSKKHYDYTVVLADKTLTHKEDSSGKKVDDSIQDLCDTHTDCGGRLKFVLPFDDDYLLLIFEEEVVVSA